MNEYNESTHPKIWDEYYTESKEIYDLIDQICLTPSTSDDTI